MCANGKYSLYSHGRAVRAPRADAGVSVRVIGCRPVEGGRQSPLQPQRGTERLFCSRRCGVEVGTHAATRSQTLARCHHYFLHRARERETEGGKAGTTEPTIIWHAVPRIFTFCLWNWGQAGLLFESGVRFVEKRLGEERLWAFFGSFVVPKNSSHSNKLLPVIYNSSG